MNARLVVVVGSAVLLMFTGVQALAVGAASRSQCQRLRGADRAPDRNVKLVKRLTRDRLADGSRGSELVGCVLLRGRVHTIATRASVENDLAQEFEYTIRQVAGTIVLLDQKGTESGYTAITRTAVWDLRNASNYTVAGSCTNKYGDCAEDNTYARKALVTRGGRAVAAIERIGSPTVATTVAIVSFQPDGTPRLLDRGAPPDLPRASLTLTGDIASWTHAGEPRSADIRVTG